jgi:hypothetical protein
MIKWRGYGKKERTQKRKSQLSIKENIFLFN